MLACTPPLHASEARGGGSGLSKPWQTPLKLRPSQSLNTFVTFQRQKAINVMVKSLDSEEERAGDF